MNLVRSKFNEVYDLIKTSSNERDMATIFYYSQKVSSTVEPKMENLSVYLTSPSRGDFQLTKDFIECGQDAFLLTNKDRTLVHLFAEKGNLEAIKYFMRYNYDLNQKDIDGNTLLHLATLNCYYDLCEYLCHQPNINVNIRNNSYDTPLDIAKRRGYDRIRDLLNKI